MLEGLKVVEFATYIAAPGAAGILAEWGAEVIKVERPAGDPMRDFLANTKTDMGANPTFDLDNRGKRAIVLDIAKPSGREALAKLAGEADIFLTNVRPAALKRAGLDYETLKAANPKLIFAIVTGYGLEGPEAHRPGFDVAAFWARAGVARLTIPKDMEPFGLRTGTGDHITALSTVSAILAAVVERGRTGKGRLVETSLLRSGIYAIGSDLAIQLRFGRVASTKRRSGPTDPIGNFFKSRDDRWFVVLPREQHRDWPAIVGAAKRPELLEDPRFTSGRLRRENTEALVAELDKGFTAMDFDEIARRMDEADLVWSPAQTAADVADDPQAIASGCFVEIEAEDGQRFRSPATPARFPEEPERVFHPAPSLGAHTREVLAELGYAPDAIDAMYAEGAAA